jgi:uncharacterized membrane protein YdjX (TVP38/TMEM64 family)
MSSRNKIISLFASFVAFIALLTVCENYLPVTAFMDSIKALGHWAPAAFVVIFIVTTALGAPTSLLSAIGGAMFGIVTGAVLAVVSVTLGATASFLFTRYYAKEFVMKRLRRKPWFIKLNEGLDKSGLYFVIFARVVPVFPFNGTNFAAGVTGVSFRDYFWGTMLGVIPANIIFVNAGSQAMEAVSGEGIDFGAIFWFSVAGALALVAIMYRSRNGAKSSGA